MIRDSAVTRMPSAPVSAGRVAIEPAAATSKAMISQKDTPLVANWQTAVSRTLTNKVDSVLGQLTRIASQDPQDSRRRQAIDTALLGRVLRTDKDAVVRKSAAWVLQGHRDGIPLLLERLRVDDDAEVREMSAWALAGMPSTDVAAALGEALKRDKSDEVRATAAWGLGHMRGRADVAALVAALSDASADVREHALWALGQLELPSAPPQVVALLKDEKDDVRLMAAWVLGVILDKATIPALREAFLKERRSETLQAELRALLFMGDRSQAVIDRAMAHEDPEIRARAVRMIAGQGPGVWPWPWPWPQPRPEP
jgi:HEAT repeat protein